MTLRYEEVAEILKIIDSSNCDEISIETAEIKLFIRRSGIGSAETMRSPSGPAAPASEIKREAPRPADGKIALVADQFEITAPMVGTFYRGQSPEAPPFVEIGSVVSGGQPLCLIEVMKLFTSLFAGASGVVRQVLVEDSELVEFGQALFLIEPQA